ncbi:uncharacterized protein LOC126844426 isoform X2 [Adelges cooleyi]|uniref:uncharacterized protein LOC126844426 isoform X2 n=1 Tax=Adelges cooleyi TaxID=133065 RepID=UPI0021809732|nr:uncharacterized protein LOC126844426 isoform X2 [Adelges cooleyi]
MDFRNWSDTNSHLQMPKLKKDAVPCIFFENKSNVNPVLPPSSQEDDNLIDIVEVDYETFIPTSIKEEPDTETSEPEQFHSVTPEQIFENICSNITNIMLPINWKYEVYRAKKQYITFYTVTPKDTELGVLIEKEIILQSDMVITLKVYNTSFDLQGLSSDSKVSSIDELLSVLTVVNAKRVCAGGPLAQEFNGITVSCASTDVQNRWRHDNCPYLFDTLLNIRCNFCKRLRATFRTQKSRLSAGQSSTTVSSLTNKSKLDKCRHKARILQKQNLRAKHRIKILQNQLNEAKEQLKSCQTTC